VAKVAADDEERRLVCPVLGQKGVERVTLTRRRLSDEEGHELEIVASGQSASIALKASCKDAPLEDVTDVGKVHLEGVLVLVDRAAHVGEEPRAAELGNGCRSASTSRPCKCA
jgi:hypothetical protein